MDEPLYAEDLVVGSVHDLGTYRVTLREILDFAEQWDPQVFHVDQAAAEEGFFGEVIASGVHTVAIAQRLAVLGAYRHWSVIAGRRVSAEFPRPVRPGDTLAGSLTIERVAPSGPGRSLVVTRGLLAAEGGTVLDTAVEAYVRRRPESGAILPA